MYGKTYDRDHPQGRRLPHAGGVRAAGGRLDALARAARQLARRRQARPARVLRRGRGHRPLRAGHDVRLRRAVSERPRPSARAHPRCGDERERRVGARLRTDVPRERRGRAARRGLGVQRLGRPRRRAVFPVGQGRSGRAEDLRARGGGQLSHGRLRARGRLHPRRRRGHGAHDRDVSALPRAQPRHEPRGDRAKTLRLSRLREGTLDPRRHRPRRDERPHRRRGLLHPAGRGGLHLDRGQGPSVLSGGAGRLPYAQSGDRRQGPPPEGA